MANGIRPRWGKSGRRWEGSNEMSDLTHEQRSMLIALANKYDERLAGVLLQLGNQDIVINSDQQAAIWESFSEKIADLVSRDHPGDDGRDADMNAEAELAVFLVSRLMKRYRDRRFPKPRGTRHGETIYRGHAGGFC